MISAVSQSVIDEHLQMLKDLKLLVDGSISVLEGGCSMVADSNQPPDFYDIVLGERFGIRDLERKRGG